ERAVVLGEGRELTVHHLPARVVGAPPAAVSDEVPEHHAVNSYRRELIVRALASARGNRATAAKNLGLHRTHLMKLLKALRIT
ncbi:MAG: helix-turn-helix domain-containing protein, partial [Candidatus Binatia bacterium]